MHYRGRKYLIEEIGYETDPARIKRAFKQGCGGVIVDGTVPANVAAEIAGLTPELLAKLYPLDPDKSLLPPPYSLRFEYKRAEKRAAWAGAVAPLLEETCRWLKEEAEWAVAAGLRPPFEESRYSAGKRAVIMRAWFAEDLARQWHIDKAEPTTWRDVHVHVQGEGLCVASPPGPGRVRLNDIYELAARGDPDHSGRDCGGDEFLKEKGFSFVTLSPGQRLVFNDKCLHRSSVAGQGGMKLRAAMF